MTDSPKTTGWQRVPPEDAAKAVSASSDGPLSRARDKAITRMMRDNLLSGEWVMVARMVNGREEAFVGLPADADAKVNGAEDV